MLILRLKAIQSSFLLIKIINISSSSKNNSICLVPKAGEACTMLQKSKPQFQTVQMKIGCWQWSNY